MHVTFLMRRGDSRDAHALSAHPSVRSEDSQGRCNLLSRVPSHADMRPHANCMTFRAMSCMRATRSENLPPV